jgi:arylsulfatase A-like enzyme
MKKPYAIALHAGIFLYILLLFSCKAKETQKENLVKHPNVLFIAVDDLNDWVAPLSGHAQTISPNMEIFASQAVNFTRNYCTSPGCAPSRASVMTGVYPYNSGMYSNYQDWRNVPALKNSVTLGQYFRQNGYYSAGAGKIYHYSHIAPRTWDDYYPSQEQNMPKEYIPEEAPMNMPRFKYMYNMFDWYELPMEDEETADFQSINYISQQLNKRHDTPFFLACGIYRPHLPWYVPKKYFDLFPLEDIQLPDMIENDTSDLGNRAKELIKRGGNYHKHVIEAGKWKEAIRGYLASIAYADAMFGRLMKNLSESEYADNTIVVLWSDHGWQLGEKMHWRKFALWENVIRTVLMIKVPEGMQSLPEGSFADKKITEPTSLIDIYPTLVDLCNLPARADLNGISLKPYLKEESELLDRPIITSYDQGDFSVRYKKWHYIKYVDDTEELYDLSKDPNEWYNLAESTDVKAIKLELELMLPKQVPLPEESLTELMEHHIPPVRSKEYYYSEERINWMKRFDNQ